ncbi:TetR/AcrR family transcriptional regulator [Streptomyces sp. adm13(2018)]|uniref:TetR/AcrR family transcriptional regulator n=1 Tax=Streptomyces sp. adm13(2018) TaxID=2479007 RepID=UPI001C9C0294|nr:TetR/AcrR family transcriptional regulator [Streptomyces sp. adm13(2018)]
MVKQDRARRTYALVLNAAAEEFAAQGFAGANLETIARRTGLTKGALYGHFPSKAALSAELTRRFEQRWQEALDAAAYSDSAPVQVLDALLTNLADHVRNDALFGAGLRLVMDRAWSEGLRAKQVQELQELLLRLVAVAQEGGMVDRSHRPEVLSRLLLAVLLGLRHLSAGSPEAQGDDSPQMWRMLLPPVRRAAPAELPEGSPTPHAAQER